MELWEGKTLLTHRKLDISLEDPQMSDVSICGSSLLGLFSQRNPPFSWLDIYEVVFWNLREKGIFWIREGGLWKRSLIVPRQNFTSPTTLSNMPHSQSPLGLSGSVSPNSKPSGFSLERSTSPIVEHLGRMCGYRHIGYPV